MSGKICCCAVYCRLCAVRCLRQMCICCRPVHDSPPDTTGDQRYLDINIYVCFYSIDSISSHSLNGKSDTNDRIGENEVLGKSWTFTSLR